MINVMVRYIYGYHDQCYSMSLQHSLPNSELIRDTAARKLCALVNDELRFFALRKQHKQFYVKG